MVGGADLGLIGEISMLSWSSELEETEEVVVVVSGVVDSPVGGESPGSIVFFFCFRRPWRLGFASGHLGFVSGDEDLEFFFFEAAIVVG